MKLLIIDNYDSFTYNLKHYAEPFCTTISVKLNDAIDVEEVAEFDKIIISPGPGLPEDAGNVMKIIDAYHKSKPILGVCLGLQAVVTYFGGELFNLKQVIHGKEQSCHILSKSEIFKNLPPCIEVGRYHSWAANKESLPTDFKVLAEDDEGVIMAVEHYLYNITAVQFHPESIMTPHGKQMIQNWIEA